MHVSEQGSFQVGYYTTFIAVVTTPTDHTHEPLDLQILVRTLHMILASLSAERKR